MVLDIPTLYIVSVITNISMTLAVVIVALRQSILGLSYLAWGLLSNTGYYLVLGARGKIPDILAVGVGNTLGSLTLTMVLLAVLCSRHKRVTPVLYIAPVILMFVVSAGFLDDRATRLITASFILSYQIILILWALTESDRNIVGRGRMIMAIASLVGLFVMVYRALSLWLGWHVVSPFQTSDALNTLFYMMNYLGMFFLAFGFVLSTAEQSAEENLRLSLQDPLTGVCNRRALFETIEKLFTKAKTAELPLSLMIIDVDLFKQVNDRYGHLTGDAVLKHVASTLKDNLRGGDIVGRYGGEEFLVVLPDTGPGQGAHVAEKLRASLASTPAVVGEKGAEQEEIGVTISIGLFGLNHVPVSQTADSMLAVADEALYKAKANGRNRVEVGDAALA